MPPLLLTHWDPDLYPARPVPPLHELVIHILAHGEVWLKEVDLFLNERIRAYLTHPPNLKAFRSLVDTGRIKILLPDDTTRWGHDLVPHDHPLLATARLRDNNKPLKSERWKLTEDVRQFCERLDSILGYEARTARNPGAPNICRPRVTPPSENQFASKLHNVLMQPGKRWMTRSQFKGITPQMAEQFADFSQDHDKALAFLAAARVKPNATNGFYRSLAYQCADEFAKQTCGTKLLVQKRAQAMKNLVQSVYAYCELHREQAAGSYSGNRLAEMPPDRPTDTTGPEFARRVDVVPMLRSIPVPVDENIGQVLSNVLEKCDQPLRVFWNLAGTAPSPEEAFRVAWGHVAEAFANEVKLPERPPKSGIVRAGELVVNGATLAMTVGGIAGFSWTPGVVTGAIVLSAIANFGWEATELIRNAQLHFQRQEIANSINAAAAIRCSWIT